MSSAMNLDGDVLLAAGGARIESFVNPFSGSGSFIHTNAADRPGEIFGGENAVYGGGAKSSYLLLPIIPR